MSPATAIFGLVQHGTNFLPLSCISLAAKKARYPSRRTQLPAEQAPPPLPTLSSAFSTPSSLLSTPSKCSQQPGSRDEPSRPLLEMRVRAWYPRLGLPLP